MHILTLSKFLLPFQNISFGKKQRKSLSKKQKNWHSMPRAGRMNFSLQQVHFDVVLKERLLPKGDIAAR